MPKEYPRPVGLWLVAAGVYVCVAGLIALLAFTLERSLSRSRSRPRKERPEVAKALAELKASRRRPSSEFEAFVRDHLGDGRVLICPTVEKRHMSAGYWPARESPGEDMAYCYVSGLSQRDPYGWVIAFDEEWSHGREGVNVLHVGGHVEWVADAEEPIRMLARQTRALGARRRRLTLVRPWWSRNPEPPPFVVPPPEESEGKKRTPVGRIVLGSMCLAAGALLLARVACGMRSPPGTGERTKRGEKGRAGRQRRRLRS